MARYTEAVCRQCRREGQKLFLKGDRCYTDKCAMNSRAFAPGQHGQGRTKNSEYGQQLREKQKAKFIYGVLEKQFHMYYEKALKIEGITGDNLLTMPSIGAVTKLSCSSFSAISRATAACFSWAVARSSSARLCSHIAFCCFQADS